MRDTAADTAQIEPAPCDSLWFTVWRKSRLISPRLSAGDVLHADVWSLTGEFWTTVWLIRPWSDSDLTLIWHVSRSDGWLDWLFSLPTHLLTWPHPWCLCWFEYVLVVPARCVFVIDCTLSDVAADLLAPVRCYKCTELTPCLMWPLIWPRSGVTNACVREWWVSEHDTASDLPSPRSQERPERQDVLHAWDGLARLPGHLPHQHRLQHPLLHGVRRRWWHQGDDLLQGTVRMQSSGADQGLSLRRVAGSGGALFGQWWYPPSSDGELSVRELVVAPFRPEPVPFD